MFLGYRLGDWNLRDLFIGVDPEKPAGLDHRPRQFIDPSYGS